MLFLLTGHIYAKNKQNVNLPDTIQIISSQVSDSAALYWKKSILFNQSDSTTQKEKQFYLQLKESAEQNKITKLLHDLLIRHRGEASKALETTSDLEKYNGKIIRNISIKQLNVFGPSLNDTSRLAKSFLEKSGNALHKNTNTKTLNKLILLKPSDEFSAIDALENERIIRAQSYIYDCKIMCTKTYGSDELIDVVYIIQDMFSYGLEAHGTFEEHEGGIYNNNLLGEGHKIYLGLAHSSLSNAIKTWGHNLQYTIRNLYGSFIDLSMLTHDTYTSNKYRFSLDKKFLTYDTKYAGGFEAQRVRKSGSVFRSDTRTYLKRIDFNSLNLWLGRSYLINKSTSGLSPNNLILAYRLQRYAFLNSNELPSEYALNNLWMLMGEINLNKSQYQKGQLLYGYGRTEDVPYGYSVKILVGNKWVNNNSFPYSGLSLTGATKLSDRFGYLNGEICFGSYINNNKAEEGVFKCHAKYFSPLINTNRTLSRHFLSAAYIKGINRVKGDSLYLSNGILSLEAFDSNVINGLQKFVVSYENVFFLRQRLLGFRVALYSFCDYGGVGINHPLEKDYVSLGIGFRIRNDNLIFNTIQIRAAYLPNTPGDYRQFSFRISDETSSNFSDFRETTSSPIVFR